MECIRILVADDDQRCLRSLQAYLAIQETLEVVGGASDGREAANRYQELRPDVVVMDVSMPDCDGVEGTRLIRALDPEARVVVLTAFDTPAVRRATEAAGASSFVAKRDVLDRLVSEIRRVASA